MTRFDQLCQLISQPENADFNAIDWPAMLAIMRSNGLLARFYLLCEQRNLLNQLPSKFRHHAYSYWVFTQAQHHQVKFECDQILSHLPNSDTLRHPPIFLKGCAYVLSGNECGAGRTFSDVDLLVDKADLNAVEHKLTLYQWYSQKNDAYDQNYYRQWAHELPPFEHGTRGTVLDVHHNLIPPISGKAPDIRLFLDGYTQLSEGHFVLAPHAMTLHSIVHLFFEEDFSKGFRDINDIHLLLTEYEEKPGFWRELLTLAQNTGFENELYMALRYSQLFFGTHIPAEVNRSLTDYVKLHKASTLFNDWLFRRVLRPPSPLVDKRFTRLARTVALLRGYLIKMPPSILAKHLWHKLSDWFNEDLLGIKKSANQ